MQDFIQRTRELIGKRLSDIREEVGITIQNLAKKTGLSTGTITSIEKGKLSFGIDQLSRIAFFYGFEVYELISPETPIQDEESLKIRIKEHHKKHESSAADVLKLKPTIDYVIKKQILKGEFLNEGKKVGEVKGHIKDEFGFNFPSSSISNALTNLATKGEIEIQNHPKLKKIKLYKKSLTKSTI